jgi:hypothetical protein
LSTFVRLFIVAIPLAVIVTGLVQLNALRKVPGSNTRTPVVLAGGLGAVVGLFVELGLAGLAGMDVGVRPEHFLVALPYALGAGVGVALAGLAGYGLLIKAGATRWLASIGILVVPVALGLSMQVVNDLAGGIDEGESMATAQREQAHVADLCSTLTIRIDVVGVEYSSTKGIERLTIDVTFTGADDVAFEPGGFMTAHETASVMLSPDLFRKLTTDVPIELKSGAPSTYPVVLAPRPDETRQHAGAWKSEVWLTRTDGETYACPVPFIVPAKAA